MATSMAMPFRKRAEGYLQKLCVGTGNRRVGSNGNRAATDFFSKTVATHGFEVISTPFECMDWREHGVELAANGDSFSAFASPYSLGCREQATLKLISTVEELATAALDDAIVLLRGEIARTQLMPKNFPFYNPDEHQRIIHLLEEKQPRAIIAATERDLDMVGAQHPFPLFEDGDFDIPSVYMTAEEGSRLAKHAGRSIYLHSRAQRIPSTGYNVLARKGRDREHKIVLFAHIDAKMGSPGASDNAGGVVVMLLLAELLANHTGHLDIEMVALNGEDYYSNPGEQIYLSQNAGKFDQIVLGINVDGVGYIHGKVAYSIYGCPDELAGTIHVLLAKHRGMVEGPQWYQGDHSLFVMQQVPALAFTSEFAQELMGSIIHTPQDTPAMVDPDKLVMVATAIQGLILHRPSLT